MQEITKRTLRVYWEHSLRYKKQFVIVWVGILVVSIVHAVEPWLYRNLVNALEERSGEVWMWFGYTLVAATANQALWRVVGFSHNGYQPYFLSDLLVTCFDKLMGHSLSFYLNSFIGALVTKVKRFASSGETVDDQYKFTMYKIIVEALISIIMLLAMLSVHPEFGVLFSLWCVVFVAVAYKTSEYRLPLDTATAEQETKVTAHLADSLTNIVNIMAFGTADREKRRFRELTAELARLRRRSWIFDKKIENFQAIAILVLQYGLGALAVYRYLRMELPLADVVLVFSYTDQITRPLWDLGRNIKQVFQAFANAEEMAVILAKPWEIVDRSKAPALTVIAGHIEFADVAFGYHLDAPIFQGLNLVIEAGTHVALVGKSGCGKSTILSLLYRFHDLRGGCIRIDGQDISQVELDSLRSSIAYVAQDPGMWNDTICRNILYPRPGASFEEVQRAAQLAQCHDFIMRLPNGYDTLVGERGVKLSGGQRQRVALARAILADSPIIALDEATSSLDNMSERLVKDALASLDGKKTMIVIAHRLTTIQDLHKIVVLGEDHRVLEQGTHGQLMSLRGHYAALYDEARSHAACAAIV